MEGVTQVAALCVTGALVSLLVRQGGSPVMGLLLALGIAAAALLFLWPSVGELLSFFQALGEKSGLGPELLSPLYKTVGIALVVRIGGDLCRDAGESALASTVETAGTICALLAALPLLRQVLSILLELMA